MKKLIIALFVLALGVGLSGRAYAATEATTLDVSVTAVSACTVSTRGVAFPVYDGTAVYANGDVTVNCSQETRYAIALDAGSNYGIVYSDWRAVSDGAGNYIEYALYQDINWIYEWGDSDYANTFPRGASLADSGDGTDQAHAVYGLLYNRSVPAGAYRDTVNVTVNY